MKTKVEGIEITPKLIEVLEFWYSAEIIENTQPYIYVQWLSKIQDYLTRVWVDMSNSDDDIPKLKEYTSMIIQIKDDLIDLIPDRNSFKPKKKLKDEQ